MTSNSFKFATPRRDVHFSESQKDKNQKISPKRFVLSEGKLALIGLIISSFILILKVIHSNREYLYGLIYENKLVVEDTSLNGEAMVKYVWTESVKYSYIWLPIICGLLTTYFTGIIVFLDSDVPGVQPPSPFSPSKYRRASGHTFHSNYAFALLIGATVTVYMYWKQFY